MKEGCFEVFCRRAHAHPQALTGMTLAHLAARVNMALLDLHKVASAASGVGGSAHVADCVRVLWVSVREQVAKAVAAKGVEFAGAGFECGRLWSFHIVQKQRASCTAILALWPAWVSFLPYANVGCSASRCD